MTEWRNARQLAPQRRINIAEIFMSVGSPHEAGEVLFIANELDSLDLDPHHDSNDDTTSPYEPNTPPDTPSPPVPHVLFNLLARASQNHSDDYEVLFEKKAPHCHLASAPLPSILLTTVLPQHIPVRLKTFSIHLAASPSSTYRATLYPPTKFYGACLDTGAQRSVCGHGQDLAYAN